LMSVIPILLSVSRLMTTTSNLYVSIRVSVRIVGAPIMTSSTDL